VTADADTLDAALDATWPAAECVTQGPFTLRRSAGGGSRVTAATLAGSTPPDPADLDHAIAVMSQWAQTPRFRVRDGQARFDACLAARGMTRHDETVFYTAPVADLAAQPPRLATFDIWPPLAIMADIWLEGGIGPDRLAVMARTTGARTALMGRQGDTPAAAAFVATHGDTAMLHALEVRPARRRQGLARHMMAHAALWAQAQGCTRLALAVTAANAPARALYAGLGMGQAGSYHYRKGALDV
jgi:GNAT superfamily N-acetyltransferase